MVTLKDFLDLDHCCCGIELDIRENGSRLLEKHIYGVSGWPGNYRDKVDDNVYKEIGVAPRQILIYLHPEPINSYQMPVKGNKLAGWGIEWDAIPKDFLKMEIAWMRPFTAAFRNKQTNGTYYSISVIAESEEEYKTPEKTQPTEANNNITFEELLEGNE